MRQRDNLSGWPERTEGSLKEEEVDAEIVTDQKTNAKTHQRAYTYIGHNEINHKIKNSLMTKI